MLCKYYQRGTCRFGDNCRYSHDDYDQGDRHHGYNSTYNDRYNYHHHQRSDHSNNNQWKQGQNSYRQSDYAEPRSQNRYAPLNETKVDRRTQVSDPSPTLDDHFDIFRYDMKDWSDSGMWSLSSYGPEKYSACLPGFEEFSFEEVRFGYITAGSEGCLGDYFRWLGGLCQTNSSHRNQLSHSHHQQRQQTIGLIKKSLAEGNDGSKKHQDGIASGPPAHQMMPSNAVGMQKSAPQVFGAVNHGFGQQQQQHSIQNSLQQTNIFQQQQQHQMPNASVSLFGKPPSQPPLFNQNPQQNFGSANHQPLVPQPMSGNPPVAFGHQGGSAGGGGGGEGSNFSFATPPRVTSAFAQQMPAKEIMNGNLYSNMDALSADDLREFQSETFTFVPTVPPPRELV